MINQRMASQDRGATPEDVIMGSAEHSGMGRGEHPRALRERAREREIAPGVILRIRARR